MCLYDHYLENINELGYIPVGLGLNKFRSEWLSDSTKDNIAYKNKNYGEYTFYYWFWKNILNSLPDNQWVGFAHYRHHWSNQNKIKSDELNLIIDKHNFSSYILKEEPPEWKEHEVILGDPMYVNSKYKLSKIIKKGLRILINNPYAFQTQNRNIKLQFDMFHGYGVLNKAIDVLDEKEKKDFKYYVNNNYSFNRENMFICRSKKLMNEYFLSVFSWLEKCEAIFGFDLKGYKKVRLYTFLAERYISYWFNKYSNPMPWPVFFFDTNLNRIDLKKNNKN
jgi:hypothetical protein